LRSINQAVARKHEELIKFKIIPIAIVKALVLHRLQIAVLPSRKVAYFSTKLIVGLGGWNSVL
jgi:hypothetical protein